MDDAKINQIVEAVIQQLLTSGAVSNAQPAPSAPLLTSQSSQDPVPGSIPAAHACLTIDLPDPSEPEFRYRARVKNPKDPQALKELIASTPARIGVGRAGPRYTTASLLLFQGDYAVTQDALYRDVDPALLDEFGLFTVQTRVTGGKEQYLLRPHLGRQLSDESIRTLAEKCIKAPNIQVMVGDGLSAAAIEANLRQIFPVIKQGAQSAGLSFGTPFYIENCRVGVLNDIGEVIKPDVVILLIGERPGLGRAESMSAYMAFKPKAGDSDADRDVVSNIFDNGGTNPLEAGAFVMQIALKMRQYQASGVRLKLAEK